MEAIRLKAEELYKNYDYDEHIQNVNFFNAKKYKESGSPVMKAFDTFIKDKEVNTSFFAYHVPSNVYDSSKTILNTIKMLKNLSTVAVKNFEKSPSLLWQYVGVPEGIFQVYPGYIWSLKNGIDLYDCRRRGWYLQGISSPKDMLILFDTSGSMSGKKFETAKVAVQLLILSLQENDFFNIIHFSSNPSYIIPTETGFIQGTRTNKVRVTEAIQEMELPDGEGDFEKAFSNAYQSFKDNKDVTTSSRCHQVIMFLTDGNEGFGDIDHLLNDEDNKKVRIFSYQIGQRQSTKYTATLKKMSCRSRGKYYQLDSSGNVWEKMLEYTTVLGHPLALNGNVSTPTYVPIYEDYSGAGMVMSVVQPMFKKKQNEHGILGLAAQDISLTELEDTIPKHMLGPDGYGFAINNNGFILFHPNLKLSDPKNTETTSEAPTLYLKQLIHTSRSEIEKLTKSMIDEEEGYKTFEVTIVGPVYKQKRARCVNMTYYYKHTLNTPFSAGIVLPTYSAITYKLVEKKFNISKGLESISRDMKNFTRITSPWPYCNYRSMKESYTPATKKVYPDLQEILTNINNKAQNVETKCDMNLIGRVLLDSISIDNTAFHKWNATELNLHGVNAIFISTYSGYSLVLNASLTNVSSKPIITNDDVQQNEFYKRAVSTHNSEHFIFEAGEDDAVTISAPIFPENSSIHAAVLGLSITTTFLQSMIEKLAVNASEYIYILDEEGYVVYTNQDAITKHNGAFFGKLQGDVMRYLVKKDIFLETQYLDHQAKCLGPSSTSSDSARPLSNPFQLLFSFLATNFISILLHIKLYLFNLITHTLVKSDDISEGFVPCVTGMRFYKVNHDQLPFHDDIEIGDCVKSFYIDKIPMTNLVLVVVNRVQNSCSKPDWKLFRNPYKIEDLPLGYNHRKLLPSCYKDEEFGDCSFNTHIKSSSRFIMLAVMFSMLIFR